MRVAFCIAVTSGLGPKQAAFVSILIGRALSVFSFATWQNCVLGLCCFSDGHNRYHTWEGGR